MRNVRASLVALCLFDDGKPLFGSGDIELLGELPAQVIDGLYDVAARLSGLGSQDKDTIEKTPRAPAETVPVSAGAGVGQDGGGTRGNHERQRAD